MSKTPKINASANSWRTRPMPAQQAVLSLDGTIHDADFQHMQRGYIPQSPQDKWFIYFSDGRLHFHRATTGACIFQLEIEAHDNHFVAPRVVVNRDPKQYRAISDSYDVELMAWLIDTYLLGRKTAFPMPSKVNKQHQERHEQHITGKVGNRRKGGGFISLDSL